MEQLSGISASNVGNVETVQHLNDYFKDISNNHLVNPFIPSKITPKKINHNPVFVDPKIMKILQQTEKQYQEFDKVNQHNHQYNHQHSQRNNQQHFTDITVLMRNQHHNSDSFEDQDLNEIVSISFLK